MYMGDGEKLVGWNVKKRSWFNFTYYAAYRGRNEKSNDRPYSGESVSCPRIEVCISRIKIRWFRASSSFRWRNLCEVYARYRVISKEGQQFNLKQNKSTWGEKTGPGLA